MRFLIVIDKLNTGGVSTSLSNFLYEIKSQGNCSLMIFSGNNKNNISIPSEIELIKPQILLQVLGLSQREVWKKSIFLGILRAILVFISKYVSGYLARKILFLFVHNIKDYDVAISFTHDVTWNSLTTGCNQFVAEKVQAKEKLSVVHCDYSRFGGYSPKQQVIYKHFNHIACVSSSCAKVFKKCFPQLNNRIIVLENFTNVDRVLAMSKDAYKYDATKFNIISVCRIAEEKGLFRAVKVFARLVNEGVNNFCWTIVGDGPDFQHLKSLIIERNLSDYINLVGEQSNPYQYIVGANLFLLPSFHEAAPMVFGECIALNVPILSTKTISAIELVADRNVGQVCENTEDGLYISLKEIIKNKGVPYKINLEVNKYALKTLNDYLHSIKK